MSKSKAASEPSIKDALQVLHPKRYSSFTDKYSANDNIHKRSQKRFNPLLMEHGEVELQDWAVIASSSRVRSSGESINIDSNSLNGMNSPLKTSISMSSSSTHSMYSVASNSNQKRATDKYNSPTRRIRKEKDPATNMKQIQGRLHLCSKSLVFEPHDISRAIIRIPFEKITSPPNPDATNNPRKMIQLHTKRITTMKKNNIIAPFETIDKRLALSFTFQHSTVESFTQLFEKIYDKPSDVVANEILPKICFDQPFDPSNFHHLNEVSHDGDFLVTKKNLRGYLLGPAYPLVKKAGCIVASKKRLYFQPYSGTTSSLSLGTGALKALSWAWCDIVGWSRRYHALRDEAVEIFFENGPSILLAFEGYLNREEVVRLIPQSRNVNVNGQGLVEVPIYCHTDRSFLNSVVTAWRNQEIDNFEYILALNSAAGRSMLDISRYPIFPWVLADYTSTKLDFSQATVDDAKASRMFRDLTKPIGALEERRLEAFRSRLKGMNGMKDSFLYGTHYSAPGYCLYYLVRAMPEEMLCLQNGKYDAPDRLFHSIERCYSSILANPADIKESIPQFYDTKSGVDILLNLRGLQLGVTQTGTILDDVKIPKWAKSPKDFIKKNRMALESEYCTKHLPAWIDLIFGAKTRGEKALNADNLFHPASYLTPQAFDALETEAERAQAELHATEFGICPDVLFSSLHPRRFENKISNNTFIALDDMRSLPTKPKVESLKKQGDNIEKLNRVLDFKDYQDTKGSNKEQDQGETRARTNTGTSIEVDPRDFQEEDRTESNILMSGSGISSKGDESIHGNGTFGSAESKDSFSAPVAEALSLSKSNGEDSGNDGWILKHVTSKEIHGGAISGCHLDISNGARVITSSLDGGLMVHLLPSSNSIESRRRSFSASSRLSRYSTMQKPANNGKDQNQLHTFRSHQSSDPLSCLATISDKEGNRIAFAGGHDDVILAYGIKSACGLASVYSHRDVVTGLVLVEHPRESEGPFTHVMISCSLDAAVKLWNIRMKENDKVDIEKEPFEELYDSDSPVECVDALNIPGVGIMVAAGASDGSLTVWMYVDGEKSVLFREDTKKDSESCSSVKWSNTNDIVLFAAYGDGKVASFLLKQDGLHPVEKINLFSPVLCLNISPSGEVFAGCGDGSLRQMSVSTAGHFKDNTATTWDAVAGEDSSSITALSVVNSGTQNERYSVCAGAEDGTVSLFHLEKL